MLTLLVSQKHGAETILWIVNSNFQASSYELNELFSCVKLASEFNCPMVVMGDFNYPGINWSTLKGNDARGDKFVNLFRGKLTYMSPKVQGYTDICHPNLYGYRHTCVVWVIYTRNPLFRARVNFFTSNRFNY